MKLDIPVRFKSDRRIHKSDVFVRDFYEQKWPKIKLVGAVIAVILLTLLGLCLFKP